MNQMQYAARVTEILDQQMGPDFEYPDSFDNDIAACFQKRMTVDEAAEELATDYSAKT